MTHTITMPLMYGTLSATAAGTRKIPEPIAEPTTTQNASTDRTHRRHDLCVSERGDSALGDHQPKYGGGLSGLTRNSS